MAECTVDQPLKVLDLGNWLQALFYLITEDEDCYFTKLKIWKTTENIHTCYSVLFTAVLPQKMSEILLKRVAEFR